MKTTLEKVRNLIAASMAGWLPEEYEQQQREEKLKGAVDRFLENHPEYIERYTSKPTTAPAVAPVISKKQKVKRIMKTLGAGAGVQESESGGRSGIGPCSLQNAGRSSPPIRLRTPT